VNTRKQVVVVPPEQQAEYRATLEQVARLAQEARTKSPLFNVVCANEEDKYRCNGLVQLVRHVAHSIADPQSSISSAAVQKAKTNQPCLSLKELEGVRGRLKELLDQSNAHLHQAMSEPRLRMRMQMLTSELSKTNANNNTGPNAAATAQAAQAVAAAATTNTPSNPAATLTGTPLQHPAMLSPEVVNNLITRPLKQEDLKPPPLPKARKQQQQAAQQASQTPKIAPSPKTVDEKPPRTPATSAATPAAESSTPGASGSAPKRPTKRKTSTATPKAAKKTKLEDKAESPSVPTPAALAATPQDSTPAAPSAPTPAASGFTGSALNVSRSTHADYFAQQQKAAEAERAKYAQFFASRQSTSAFDGDIAAALSMWESQQAETAAAPGPGVGSSNLGEAAAVLAASAQTEDALADQSWHDFINEQNFDPDEPTPLLTRCRSLDTDPECSPRDADLIGRSPLVQMHVGVGVPGGYATAHDKFGNGRRVPLMSPSAQPYNGMLYVDHDDTTGLEGFM
jgi:hypothetical protein